MLRCCLIYISIIKLRQFLYSLYLCSCLNLQSCSKYFGTDNILVQVQVATRKTKLDIQQSKLDIQVASRVPERRKTWDIRKLENIGIISK